MRRAVAQRMTDSKQQAPHFYVQTEVAMDALTSADRRGERAARPAERVTATAALVARLRGGASAAAAVQQRLDGRWAARGRRDQRRRRDRARGRADRTGAARASSGSTSRTTAAALRDLVERARGGEAAGRAELTDATFTLSNLGMFDVSAFTAIVTPPQVAILATGRAVAARRAGGRRAARLVSCHDGDAERRPPRGRRRRRRTFSGSVQGRDRRARSLLSRSEQLEEARS